MPFHTFCLFFFSFSTYNFTLCDDYLVKYQVCLNTVNHYFLFFMFFFVSLCGGREKLLFIITLVIQRYVVLGVWPPSGI